jgi:hypothetical protein
MKLKFFFCQFPNPWTLRVSGMGGYTSKCEKKSKSLHPSVPVERLYCKRPILCLASSKILTPHPLTARRVCTPPSLVRGEDTLAGWRGGWGVNILEDARHSSVLYICKYFVGVPVCLKRPTIVFFLLPRNLSHRMIRQAHTGNTVLVKSREMTGWSQTLTWWLGVEGIKMTENKIHWPAVGCTAESAIHPTGQDRTGQDRTGQDRTGQDRFCGGTTALSGVRTDSAGCRHLFQDRFCRGPPVLSGTGTLTLSGNGFAEVESSVMSGSAEG